MIFLNLPSDTAACEARAKINLILYVVSRRSDGYHGIVSLMQSVALSDTLRVALSPGGVTAVYENGAPCRPRDSIALKAAERFFSASGIRSGADIRIFRRIPACAGLGGASACAAGVLSALNRLAGKPFSDEQLSRLGSQIGADVPFCLRGGTALAEGIGERITPLPPLPRCPLVICKPRCAVSTPQAYSALDAALGGAYSPAPRMPDTRSLRETAEAAHNDFELIMPEECRSVKKTMAGFGPLASLLTGSGSSVFSVFEDPEAARACADRLREDGGSEVFETEPAECGVFFPEDHMSRAEDPRRPFSAGDTEAKGS